MRYGTSHCGNDRLPAERLEQAVARRLWQVLNDRELIDQAITETYENIAQHDEHQQNELAAIQCKLAQTRTAMDRYFRAFETATMPEDTCAPRIATLSEEAKALEARATELAAQDDEERPERATSSDLDAMRTDLRDALNNSAPSRVKTVLQTLIDGIQIHARDNIQPTFRIPAVRVDYDYMEPTGIEPVTSCLQTDLEDLRKSADWEDFSGNRGASRRGPNAPICGRFEGV